MSRFDDEEFLPWYRRATAGWLELSASARGVLVSISMELNPKTGVLTLKRGLPSLSTLLRMPWEQIEPALAELLATEKLVWDGARFQLTDPEHADRKRKTSTQRVQALRDRAKAKADAEGTDGSCNAGNVSRVTSVSPGACNDETVALISSSLISSDLISEIPEEIPSARPRATVPNPSEPAPPWFAEVLRTIADATDTVLPNGLAWIRYAGHRATKRLPATREDALQWLGGVMVPEEQKKRIVAADKRERDAKFDAERAAKRSGAAAFAEPVKLTQEQQRELAEKFPMVRRPRGNAA